MFKINLVKPSILESIKNLEIYKRTAFIFKYVSKIEDFIIIDLNYNIT